jgi:hypothetical protein
MRDDELPASLTVEEAYRAAVYMMLGYQGRGDHTGEIQLLILYLWDDPARWDDWKVAVGKALLDGGLADPVKDGRYHPDRPEIPWES